MNRLIIVRKYKKNILAFVIICVLTISCGLSTVPANADSLFIIRVGLTEHLKQQSKVTVSTKKIAIGYCVNNRFSEYIHFTSKNGFTFTPAKGYYLVADTIYPDYASVKKAYNRAKKISSVKKHCYICMTGKNKWCLYVGGDLSLATVSNLRDKVDGKVGTTFGSVTSYNGQRVMISGGGNAILYDGSETGQYAQIAPNVLNKKGSKTLTVNGYEYRGRIEIGPYGSKSLTVVNICNVENYLRSVVGTEMNQSYPLEAMKAQAIVSRTYAENQCNNTGDTNTSNPYVINDTTDGQAYGGYKKESNKAVEAVTSTRGKCIYSSGSQINALFCKSSGGVTENSKNVWGFSETYLTAKADIAELTYMAPVWKKTYTAQNLGDLLGVGKVINVSVDSTTPSGRIYQLTVTGEKDSITLKGENVYQRLQLKSSKCQLVTKQQPNTTVSVQSQDTKQDNVDISQCSVVSSSKHIQSLQSGIAQYLAVGAGNVKTYMRDVLEQEDVYMFVGLGEGAGVGMSQTGAKAMASKGADATAIIKKYYGNKVTIR